MVEQDKDYFSAVAENYAQFRPSYPTELVNFLAEHSPDCGRVWDAGAGSGQLSVKLTQQFKHVVATDLSHTQLQQATPHPSITYFCAKSEQSGLKNRSVDLAVCAQAAHWFDLPAYYAEVKRVLKPGGLLALICYYRISGEPEVTAVIDELYGPILRDDWPPGREAVDSRYQDIYFPFTVIDTPVFSIDVQWTRNQLMGYLLSWSATKRYEAAGKGSIHAWLVQQLVPCWPNENQVKAFYFPIYMRAAKLP